MSVLVFLPLLPCNNMLLTLSIKMMNIVLTLGLSSNKKVTGELILVCTERWFTHEQVA